GQDPGGGRPWRRDRGGQRLGAGRGQPGPAAAVRLGGAGAVGGGRGGHGGEGLRGGAELLPGHAGGDPAQGEPGPPADGGAAGVQPAGGAVPDRGGAHDGAAEPLHGAAAGVPGAAARGGRPGDPGPGEAGERGAAGQATEDLRRVKDGPQHGAENGPVVLRHNPNAGQASCASGSDNTRAAARRAVAAVRAGLGPREAVSRASPARSGVLPCNNSTKKVRIVSKSVVRAWRLARARASSGLPSRNSLPATRAAANAARPIMARVEIQALPTGQPPTLGGKKMSWPKRADQSASSTVLGGGSNISSARAAPTTNSTGPCTR